MKTFKEFCENKINDITLYHGDNFGTKETKSKLMNNGNNQEGIGIYFSPHIKTATIYGNKIVKVEVNKEKFIDSRLLVKKVSIITDKLKDLLVSLFPYEKEAFFYEYTNYFSDITDQEDMTADDVRLLSDAYSKEEVRNLQITLAEITGVENFVKEWNRIYPDIWGTVGKKDEFYAIIKTGLKTESVK